MEKVNVIERFANFNMTGSPKIVGEFNGQYVKLAKLKGEAPWHCHENEDELLFVIRGRMILKLRDNHVVLKEGEFLVIPRGVEHKSIVEKEADVLMLEPVSVVNNHNIDMKQIISRLEVYTNASIFRDED